MTMEGELIDISTLVLMFNVTFGRSPRFQRRLMMMYRGNVASCMPSWRTTAVLATVVQQGTSIWANRRNKRQDKTWLKKRVLGDNPDPPNLVAAIR